MKNITYTHYVDDGESFNYRNGEYNEYIANVVYINGELIVDCEKIYNGLQQEYNEIKWSFVNK